MRKVNSYVKIYQEKLKMKNKVEKKEEEKKKEEDINFENELPIILLPDNIGQTTGKGINFGN